MDATGNDFSSRLALGVTPENLGKSKIFGKQGSPFIVETKSEVLDFDSGKMQVSVDITSSMEFEEISYKWVLPNGVALSSGLSDGAIANISVENPVRLVLEVSGLNLNINQNIVLLIERHQGIHNLGSSFIVASRKDLTEEYQKMPNEYDDQYELKAAAFGEEARSTKLKLVY
jgi:hypothetical protein